MRDIRLFIKVKDFAAKKHLGQKRNNGEPYFTHPMRVSWMCRTDLQKNAALLHDVLEDTNTTFVELVENFGMEIAYVVDLLTHKKGESHYDYITRVLTDENAIRVKIADICDNMNDNPSENAIKKNLIALPRLLKYDEQR